jgi:ribokinase
VNVCVVGSTSVDLVTRVPRLPAPGETIVGRSFSIGNGGKGGNQAVMAANLGAAVTLVSRIGGDDFGASALANYRARGIDVRFVVRDETAATGVAPIFVDDDAQNCIAVVPGANGALSAADVHAAAAAIAAADVLICQLEVPLEAVHAAFALARAAGVISILNPAPAADVPADIWQLTDIVVPNETEAALLTGRAVDDDARAERAARALLAYGPGVVIVTLGVRGSLVVTGGFAERVAPVAVAAVDTTGAGDAYVGTLAVCLAAGMPALEAARRANLVAALSVTQAGTQTSFPDARAAAEFVARHGLSLPVGVAAMPAVDRE